MRAVIIFNPAAGQRDHRAAIREVAEYLRSLNWQVEVRETVQSGDATAFARDAAARQCDIVFVAGGDGTINEAVNGLAYTRVALGVLPSGTANVWAQEIGLPVPRLLSPDPNPLLSSARMLSEGVMRTMDLGRIGDRYFMLYGSVGFDAQVVQEMESQKPLKQQLGGWAYYLAGATAAWSFRGVRATLVLDGKRLRRRIWAVMAANTQLYGGIMRIASEAYADDGLLDIVVIRGHGLLATIRHYAGFLLRGVWADPQVEFFRAHVAEIITKKPMAVQVDGDAHGASPVTIVSAPRALNVLVPRGVALRIFRQAPL